MKLYEVSDNYIIYLKQFDSMVLDNHFVSHNRKYLGIGLIINQQQYYLPLSHPDATDYINGKPRKTVPPIFRMVTNNGRLLGKILINNMIPVPSSELVYYDVNKESDFKYKNLVLAELRIIKQNQSKIIHNANLVYNQKVGNMGHPYLNATVDFIKLEHACASYNSP